MQIRIRLFANLKEIFGSDHIEIDIPKTLPAGELATFVAAHYPHAADALVSVMVARNQQLARAGDHFATTDEIAFLPPVGGGESQTFVTPSLRLSDQPLIVSEAYSLLEDSHQGGTVLFIGTVREWTGDKHTKLLTYEAYTAMVQRQMAQIERDVEKQFPGVKTLQWHRIGDLKPMDIAVICGASAPHRAYAFEAANLLIERLKKEVAIWKKEVLIDGHENWTPNA